MHLHKMGLANYIQALEEEKKKIQVFSRDLPLSLELVTQAIEKCIQQLSGRERNLNGQSECSAQISTEEDLVVEEFIPIKKTASPSYCDEEDNDDNDEHSSHKMKSVWLRSVQLWSPNPLPAKETVPRKTSVVEVKRIGGAFHPFHKEKIAAEKSALITSPEQVPATSSTEPVVEGSNKIEDKGQRKQRRCWSQELHKRFLHALQQLGGSHSATPKQIRELMKIDGLTNDEIKSHLQKFRLHTRRSLVIHNNAIANSQAAHLFLVGNIYVQPQEYVPIATTATATVSGELTTVTTPTGTYAHPQVTTTFITPRFKKQHLCENSHSEERANHCEGVVVQSNSSASSYSTHTPTTLLGC
ncbi:transcription factor HHO3-like [Vicia villosa]|uniref:transcription factor HHO3-like n=1 Tax=Vicia villosa TaxID=3911 RepID=UPI00273B28AE|nr:transcription factor HHO3-like [Vicia villosa]